MICQCTDFNVIITLDVHTHIHTHTHTHTHTHMHTNIHTNAYIICIHTCVHSYITDYVTKDHCNTYNIVHTKLALLLVTLSYLVEYNTRQMLPTSWGDPEQSYTMNHAQHLYITC